MSGRLTLRLAAAVASLACALPAGAAADGVAITGAADGVSVAGSPYGYVALSPDTEPRLTVVERLDRKRGKVARWWYLRGDYYVPAVAYDRTPGGLSADGRILVLAGFPRSFPPRHSRFAVLDTALYLRHPRRPGRHRAPHAIDRFTLPGSYSFDAISPDGSTLYLIHSHFAGHRRPGSYEVRALDLATGRLLPDPIVDPKEPDEQMQGMPITRVAGADGRWAYTLYDGNGKTPFIHALDTVRGRAVCVDLPQLKGNRNPFMLGLRLSRDDGELTVYDLPGRAGGRASAPILNVDTRTFEVHRTVPVATAGSGDGLPWAAIGVACAALCVALAWALSRRRRGAHRPGLERR